MFSRSNVFEYCSSSTLSTGQAIIHLLSCIHCIVPIPFHLKQQYYNSVIIPILVALLVMGFMKIQLPSDAWCDNISNSSSAYTDVVSNQNQVKEDHVKRPLNKFMCYSKLERAKIRKENPQMNQKDISSMLGKKWKTLSPAEQQEYEQKAVDLKHLHQTQFPQYKYRPKRRGTSTKKTRYFSDGLRKIQPAIHQSTRTPHMMSTTNPELNNYPLAVMPDYGPILWSNSHNVRHVVSTNSSKPSTSHLAGMYMSNMSPFSGEITETVETNY